MALIGASAIAQRSALCQNVSSFAYGGYYSSIPTHESPHRYRRLEDMSVMESLYQYAWLIPVLPLLGATLVGLGLVSYGDVVNRARSVSSIFIVSLVGVTMVMSFALLWSQLQGHEPYLQIIDWASAGDFHLTMGYTIDHLTSLMLVVVTTVAFLVMIYTDGYMSHDPGYVRFYAYLSLFSSSMLGLVISPNLVQIYVFWELVGMCSYLLIGFWYDR